MYTIAPKHGFKIIPPYCMHVSTPPPPPSKECKVRSLLYIKQICTNFPYKKNATDSLFRVHKTKFPPLRIRSLSVSLQNTFIQEENGFRLNISIINYIIT